MNTADLLGQIFRSMQGSQHAGSGTNAAGQGGLGDLLGGVLGGHSPTGRDSAGAGLGGLLDGLLRGQRGGSLGGNPSSAGGSRYAVLASLGMMAFKAYQSWQQQQASSAAPDTQPHPLATANRLELAGPALELHSHAVLCAMIAAAKANGPIDDEERRLIDAELDTHRDDTELHGWLENEVAKDLNVADVAQAAQGDAGVAAQMYLASVMVVGDQDGAERGYLDNLAAALNIESTLQSHLEQQLKQGV